MKVEVKGRIATGQPLKFYCETPVPMNLHGNSPPRRDVHLVRINSVTSNERREDGEELRRRYRRKGDPRPPIDPPKFAVHIGTCVQIRHECIKTG